MSDTDESSEEAMEEPNTEPEATDTEVEGEETSSDDTEADPDELRAELEALREERDELSEKLARKAADFENYKKRQRRRREQLEETATEELVTRLLDVRDNLTRALAEEHDDIESLREGVKLTLAEFDRVMDAEGVSTIEPDPGSDVDPDDHEVMLQVPSEYPAGTIDEVYQPGYRMGDRVLRPAQVTVSDGDHGDDETEE